MIKNDGFSVVVGIDVREPKKGFHAIALRAGRYLATYADTNPASIATWYLDIGARFVRIDARTHSRSNLCCLH